MNFFEHQDRARKQTGRLVLLLTVAVICLVTITSLALGWLWRHLGEPALHLTSRASLPDFELYLSVAAVIVGVVVLGALYKQVQLSAGGKVVAESLGGRLLNLSASNADERRLLNVVEEMALASGSPVPPVYVAGRRLDQRLCRRPHLARRGDRHYPRRHRAARPQRATGRDRS